jgi:hypothetical protein
LGIQFSLETQFDALLLDDPVSRTPTTTTTKKARIKKKRLFFFFFSGNTLYSQPLKLEILRGRRSTRAQSFHSIMMLYEIKALPKHNRSSPAGQKNKENKKEKTPKRKKKT